MIIDFTKELDIELLEKVEKQVYQELYELPAGKWQIEIRKPKRTPAQNNLIHAVIFPQTAEFLNLDNTHFSFGKGLKAEWNTITVKEVFFKTLYTGGLGTSELTTKEMAEAIRKLELDMNLKKHFFVINEKHKNEYIEMRELTKEIK